MSDTEDLRDRTHREITFDTDLGQKAHVERQDDVHLMDEDWKRANQIVRAIGEGQNPKPDDMIYHGSLVVHIYTPKTIEGMMFQTQVLCGSCPEWLADKGLTALRKDAMAAYGRKRPVKRSGW